MEKRADRHIKFTKMQGAGNDYIYIDCTTSEISDPSTLAVQMSDRHFGIGSDGLVLILSSKTCDFAMRMFNSDGSEAGMCGNASRCVGKFVYDKGLTKKTSFTLETRSGVKELNLHVEDGMVKFVTVNMGKPELLPSLIPVSLPGDKVLEVPLQLETEEVFPITCVSMGNPHTVIFVEDMDKIDVHRIGSLIENHPLFPERCNVGFVQVLSRSEIKLRVWERGAGETLACGTGACAAVTASILNGFCDMSVGVHVLGGKLQIEWKSDGCIYMTGGAEFVFDGTYFL